MKIGFNTSETNPDAEEPNVGHADSVETLTWWDTAYPMLIDFAIVYGVFSAFRDIIKACKGGGNHAAV